MNRKTKARQSLMEKKKGEKENEKNNNTQSSKEIVLKALMHCEGCKSIEDVVVDYANHRVLVKGKKGRSLEGFGEIQKKYSSYVELISPKSKPENKEKKGPQKQEKINAVSGESCGVENVDADINKDLEKMKG